MTAISVRVRHHYSIPILGQSCNIRVLRHHCNTSYGMSQLRTCFHASLIKIINSIFKRSHRQRRHMVLIVGSNIIRDDVDGCNIQSNFLVYKQDASQVRELIISQTFSNVHQVDSCINSYCIPNGCPSYEFINVGSGE